MCLPNTLILSSLEHNIHRNIFIYIIYINIHIFSKDVQNTINYVAILTPRLYLDFLKTICYLVANVIRIHKPRKEFGMELEVSESNRQNPEKSRFRKSNANCEDRK